MYDPYNPYETEKPKIEVNFKRHRISTKKNGIGTVNAGGAIIIIIFVVLCLTIFGLLSFATSFADKKLADKNLKSVEQYYKADAEAEEKLAAIYDAVYAKMQTGPAFDVSFVKNAVSVSNIPFETDISEYGGGVKVAYKTVLGEPDEDKNVKFYLNSEIILYSDKTYKIIVWKMVFDSDLDYDNDQYNVWEGFDW